MGTPGCERHQLHLGGLIFLPRYSWCPAYRGAGEMETARIAMTSAAQSRRRKAARADSQHHVRQRDHAAQWCNVHRADRAAEPVVDAAHNPVKRRTKRTKTRCA